MTRVVQGVVRGKSIALDEDLGFIDGQVVQVTIRPVAARTDQQSGEGFLRTEGALADDSEWDAIMDEIHRARKDERRPQAAVVSAAPDGAKS